MIFIRILILIKLNKETSHSLDTISTHDVQYVLVGDTTGKLDRDGGGSCGSEVGY